MTAVRHRKVALVTGGGSGIGRATALAFAACDTRVAVADLSGERGRETVAQIQDAGGAAMFVEADVSKADEVRCLIERVVGEYGRLDYAHNNVATSKGPTVPTHEITEHEWDRVIGVDLKSVFVSMKFEIPQMLEQGHGAIVNTASVSGLVAGRNDATYTAAKHGVVGLTRSAAVEYANLGIRVNCVCPGWIDTPRTDSLERSGAADALDGLAQYPMRRKGTAEEIAAAVVWLCSDAAGYVTGHTLSVDGGYVAQ